MSKSIYNNIGCSKSCQSKALKNTSIIRNEQQNLNLEDFINQQTTIDYELMLGIYEKNKTYFAKY